jgi:mannose-6-phosphate isomerase-like protein (cupin superfamily)
MTPENIHHDVIAAQGVIGELLSPIGWQRYLDEYHDRQPLYLSGGAQAFSPLCNAEQLRVLIESGSPWQFRRLPEMYLDGGFVPHEDLVRDYTDMDGRAAKVPILARIKRILEAGGTANCFGQEAHFPALAELKLAFACAFSAEVETSLFYSQKDHQGLAPHYDCVDIFVLQISGSKRWHVSTQRVDSPVVGYGVATGYDTKAAHATIELEPGDLLYIPRGTFHHACALTNECVHTSVAVKLPTYLDMMNVLLQRAAECESVRAYLPVGGSKAWSQASPQFAERLAQAIHQPGFMEALDRLLLTRAGMQGGT